MADVMQTLPAFRDRSASRQAMVAGLAARQHGVVALWQLLELGFSRSAIHRWVEAGRLAPVHRGTYAVGGSVVSAQGRWMSAALACGPSGALSHVTAAGVWAILPTQRARIDVTTPQRPTLHGVTVHHVRQLGAADRTRHDGLPVTTVARTLLDLAEVAPPRRLIRAIEASERLRLFDLRAIEQLIGRSRGRHGIGSLRAAIASVEGEPPRVNSGWERDLLDFCDDHDIPRPELNFIVEGYEVDALWRGAKLIVELDSWGHHRSRRAFEEDRRRDAALQLAGYVVLRITWRRLVEEPEEVARLIRRRVAA